MNRLKRYLLVAAGCTLLLVTQSVAQSGPAACLHSCFSAWRTAIAGCAGLTGSSLKACVVAADRALVTCSQACCAGGVCQVPQPQP